MNNKTDFINHFSSYYLKPVNDSNDPVLFHNEVLTIGRSESCDIRIDNPYLSQVHSSFFYKDGDFYLTDLNSTNGTFVNKERIKVKKLSIGDYIGFSNVTYRLMPLVNVPAGAPGDTTLETVNPFQNPLAANQLFESAAAAGIRPPPLPAPGANPSLSAKNQAALDEAQKKVGPLLRQQSPFSGADQSDVTSNVGAMSPESSQKNLQQSPGSDAAINVEQHVNNHMLPIKEPKLPSSVNSGFGGNLTRSIFNPIRPTTPIDVIPGLEFSGFIFEEQAKGEVFSFTSQTSALEITTFVNDFVISVDYFCENEQPLKLSGVPSKHALLSPVVSFGKSFNFLTYEKNNYYVSEDVKNCGFTLLIFSKNGIVHHPEVDGNNILIENDYVVTLKNDYLEMVLKYSSSPPRTLPVPFVLFDALLNKIMFGLFPLYLAMVVTIVMVPEKERDFDEEKIEIDRIVMVEKMPEIMPTPKPIAERIEKVTPISDPRPQADKFEKPIQTKVESKLPETKKMENSALSLPPVENKKSQKVVTPPPVIANNVVKPSKVTQSVEPSQKAVLVSSEGIEPVAPSLNIKSLHNSVASNFAKSGVGSSAISNSSSSDLEGARSDVGVIGGDKVRNVAPLKAASVGNINVLGEQKGSLSSGRNIPSTLGGEIGIFDRTGGRKVILGIMDPQEIQNILRRYIPQFQFCYEQELERINKKTATTLVLDFNINSIGKVENDSYSSKNITFSSSASECFSKILQDIQFSKPKGGGTVKVKQPINMEPRF